MFVVGLTGGIGSGKSEVARCFRDLGIHVVDADQLARKVVEPGMPALTEISARFGKDILLPDGNLNRSRLREIIFQDPEAKAWLEELLHPLIREMTVNELAAATSPYAILESPLLLERGQADSVNRVLVVDVPVDIQIVRACSRDNNSEPQIKAIIGAQISREMRLAAADDVIDNTCSLDQLPQKVKDLHDRYLQLAMQ